MTKSPIERMVFGLRAWLAEHFHEYITLANLSAGAMQAPQLREILVSDTMDPGKFPQMIVNAGPVYIQEHGPQTQLVTVSCGVDIGIQAPKPEAREVYLMRYMDALTDAIGENETLGGLVLQARIDELDKDSIPQDGRGFVVATISMTDEIVTD
jgi:hypothetical protein